MSGSRLCNRRIIWTALLACVVGLTASAAPAGDDPPRPNWNATATGTTRPGHGMDLDSFAGLSTHLGRFTGEGHHVLNPVDFTFVGEATWTAADGATLRVMYTGQLFLSGDPVYPFGFVADCCVAGGTGRLAGATGDAVMTGALTGLPGEYYFDIEGTLHLAGR